MSRRELVRGMTIVEVMIALLLSLIVLGAVITVYLTTLRSSGDTLKSSRLNQEVSAIMTIMADDIRRAGFALASGPDWDNPDPAGNIDPDDLNNFEEPETNPFSQPDWTALEVRDAGNVKQGPMGSGTCILYAYDANPGDLDADTSGAGDGDTNGDGVAVRENNEYFGFRLNGNAVEMRRSVDIAGGDTPNSCATDGTSGTWEDMNDTNDIHITTLTFDLGGSQCMNTLEPDGRDNNNSGTVDELEEQDCYGTNTNIFTNATYRATYAVDEEIPVVETRNVTITLTAVLANDPQVKITKQQQVTVRNNLIRSVATP